MMIARTGDRFTPMAPTPHETSRGSTAQTWRRDVGALLLLALLTLAFFWRYVTPVVQDRLYFPDGDFTNQFYAYRVLAYRSLSQGEVPLWSTCLFSGYPFQADPQSAVFYPPALLLNGLLWAAGTAEYPLSALTAEVVFHVFLAGAFTYFFLRDRVPHRAAALLGAVVFAFGGFLTGYPLLQVAILEGAVWLPLALWAAGRLSEGKGRAYVAVAGGALASSVLAGHPQTAVFVAWTALAYTVFCGWKERLGWRNTIANAALVVASGAALSAVQWLPSWELVQQTARAVLDLETAGTGFSFQDLLQFLIVRVGTGWHPLYLGILPLLLALLSQGRAGFGRAEVLFWMGLGLVGLLLSFGHRLPVFDLAYRLVPGYQLFRGQERHALVVSFSLSVLSAFGAAMLFRPLSQPARRWLRRGSLLLASLVSLSLVSLGASLYVREGRALPDTLEGTLEGLGATVLLLILALGVVTLRLRSPRRRALLASVTLAIVVLDLFWHNREVNASGPYDLYPVTPVVQPVVQDSGLFRLQDDFRLPGHAACMLGIKEIWGISPLRLARYEEFLERAPERVRWDLLAVRYLVTWRGRPVTHQEELVEATTLYQEGEATDPNYLYRLEAPKPWAWVVRDVRVAGDNDALYETLSAPDFDPWQTAVLAEPVDLSGSSEANGDRVSVEAHTPHRLELSAELTEPGLLVMSEIAYPGWRAEVNGQARPIHQADGILRAILLGAGPSEVRMLYEPATFRLGGLLSAVGWSILALWLAWSARRSVRPDVE